ncbi:unnamed protein product, partial [Hydatigera taeniaeformis]|uniref:HemK methyltransferase family member 2 n=1 Tax=Hydatigena taeniaeformis TaxID=6205 RepID=A0A0R3XCL3_HYDTA
MLPLDHVYPTPNVDVLSCPCFAEVYPPSEDSFLFLDALETDVNFIRGQLKPACAASKQVFCVNTSRYLMDAVCCDLLTSIRSSPQGIADIVLFNPPYVPTGEDELMDAKSTISSAWAGGVNGRQLSPVLTKSGALYILLLKQNEPELVSKFIRDASGGRLSASVRIIQRQCGNEQLSVKHAPRNWVT